MMIKKKSKFNLKQAIFGFFFAIMGSLTLGLLPAMTEPVYADPSDAGQTSQTTMSGATEAVTGDACKKELGEIAWLVCPSTGKIAEATDWLYEKIEDVLVISPASMEDGSPIYEIWKYCRGITNVVFIIFLLVVVYSQITGLGINNYGIKKALPKLIIAAVLVNLSFYVCTLAVDLSNVIGNGLRGMFASIAESAMAGSAATPVEQLEGAAWWDHQRYQVQMENTLYGGALLATFVGLSSLGSGAIWMLIPVVLGGIVAVASGLITIALRQAVVTILMMIAPLAMVAYMLPNTEQWFKKWKDLLFKMLVFYPMFSLLFGASNLAGFAIIRSAKEGDGFVVLLGTAVQIFPLFFSWNLMKMSGTFLGTINTKIRGLAARPLATNRAWAESRRALAKQKRLASSSVLPSARLAQYLSNRKIAREEESAEYATTIKKRGQAYAANRNYKENGVPTKEGMEAYERQARNMRYDEDVMRHKNNMVKGLGGLEVVKANATIAERAKLAQLDAMNVKAADDLFVETVRGEKIQYNNAVSRHARFENAINAHMDLENGFNADGSIKDGYKFHFDPNRLANSKEIARYNTMKDIMEGNVLDVQYAAASAAHDYDSQSKIVMTKFQKYFELTPPTRDLRYRLAEFSQFAKKAENEIDFDIKSSDNIDMIVSGLRILNQRGDTDCVKNILDDILDKKYGGLRLGTHASQALANFLMFDVKDNDPYLRRFGKYINLETARMYDKNERQKDTVDYDEYVKGYHYEPDGTKMYAKKDIVKLMEGTPLDGIERTALDNYDESLRKAYTDEHGNLDYDEYIKRREEVDGATIPQFISANQKFLSGSEQIVSAVKSKTGFAAKQDQETGEYTEVPIWEDEKEMAKLFGSRSEGETLEAYEERLREPKDNLRKWFMRQTLGYLEAQTPAQILGLRTDYKKSLIEHLSEGYIYDDKWNEMPDRVAEREAFENDLISRYGSLDSDGAKKELEAKKMVDAGEKMREILFKKGKLDQIEKSKRSGMANNAKDWVRELLLLDTDYGLRKWILEHRQGDGGSTGSGDDDISMINSIVSGDSVNPVSNPIDGVDFGVAPMSGEGDENPDNKKKQIEPVVKKEPMAERKLSAEEIKKRQLRELIEKMKAEVEEQRRREADPIVTPGPLSTSIYTATDVAAYSARIRSIWEDIHYDSVSEDEYAQFFEESLEYIMEILGESSYVVKMYQDYYRHNPAGESYDLMEYLISLLESLLETSI